MPSPSPLHATGRLTLIDPQHRRIDVEARGAVVDIGFPDLGSASQAYAALTRASRGHRAMALLQRELRGADLALQFSVRGVAVAQLSGHSLANLAGAALGLDGTRVRLSGVLRALLAG